MNVPHDDLRGAYRSNVIALIAFTLVLSLAWLWFAFNPVPLGRSVMMLANPTVHGSAALCPGDTLRFSFVTTVHTPAVVDFDITTWGQDPRRIILQRPDAAHGDGRAADLAGRLVVHRAGDVHQSAQR